MQTDLSPLSVEVFPALFREPSCQVVALDVERTFWEKVTLLHVEYHRPADKPFALGMSRHYSDLASLSQHPAGEAAATDLELLARVRLHKETYFRSAWARYETAVPGSLRLYHPMKGAQMFSARLCENGRYVYGHAAVV